MKYAILVFVCCFVAIQCGPKISQDIMLKFKKPAMDCMQNQSVNMMEAQEALLPDKELSPKNACLLACVLKQMKLMNDKNEFEMSELDNYKDDFKSSFEEKSDDVLKAFDVCKKEEKPTADECEAAATLKKCLVKNMKDKM